MAGESLLMFPSGFKAGKLYSQIPTDGVGDFTVNRAGNKTRRNSLNVTEVLSANVPSIDYTGGITCPILLSESQSTNLYLNSEVMITQDVTVAASEYTVSFYGTGTITFTGTHTGSLVGTGLNDLVSITFTSSAGTLTSTISGTVTEGQIELGAYASSRIITVGTTVTRLVDEITDAGDVNTFNSTEGVLYLDINIFENSDFNSLTIREDVDATNKIRLIYHNSQLRYSYEISNVKQCDLRFTLSPINEFHKIILLWKINRFELWVDGIIRGSDVSGNVLSPNTLNTLNYNAALGFNRFFSKTKQLKVYKSISNAQLNFPYIT